MHFRFLLLPDILYSMEAIFCAYSKCIYLSNFPLFLQIDGDIILPMLCLYNEECGGHQSMTTCITLPLESVFPLNFNRADRRMIFCCLSKILVPNVQNLCHSIIFQTGCPRFFSEGISARPFLYSQWIKFIICVNERTMHINDLNCLF